MSATGSDGQEESYKVTTEDYQMKLEYENFKNFAKKQQPEYFKRNPKLLKLFKDQIKNNDLSQIVPKDSDVYIDWMKEFEKYKEDKDQNDLLSFFDYKI